MIDALNEARDQGKVRWIGTSSALEHKPTFLEWGSFDVFQLGYSALDRTTENFITEAADAGDRNDYPERRGTGRTGGRQREC